MEPGVGKWVSYLNRERKLDSLSGRRPNLPAAPKGLYIYGDVGSGLFLFHPFHDRLHLNLHYKLHPEVHILQDLCTPKSKCILSSQQECTFYVVGCDAPSLKGLSCDCT